MFLVSKNNPCTFAIFSTFEDPSYPSFSLSLEFSCLCYSSAIFVTRCFVIGVSSQQEKALLLLRHLRTFRGPSWIPLFLSLEFCYICSFCDFCDLCHRCFQLARKILVTFATFADFSRPFLASSLSGLEFCYICYFCNFCDICHRCFQVARKILVTLAAFATFADISGPFLASSLSKS